MSSLHEPVGRAVDALLRRRGPDGGFEGEMRWCPMLTAQYVLFHHALGVAIPPARQAAILRGLERSALPDGTFGLHPHATTSLYVTTLVYVAARMAGAPSDAPWLAPSRALFARESVLGIATWGRVWLALVGLFSWEGVHALPVELFRLPAALPVHPSRLYCHTRRIYLALSVLRSTRPSADASPIVVALRDELHPGATYRELAFVASRGRRSPLDLAAPPSPWLRVAYGLGDVLERAPRPRLRARTVDALRDELRAELRSTQHRGISPVSGMLSMLALGGASDPDVARGLAALETWGFEDDVDGFRLSGARSQTWDTSFALVALAEAAPFVPRHHAIGAASSNLAAQQLEAIPTLPADRLDPDGGFCFADRGHGWPVSDCTAEAMYALMRVDATEADRASMVRAARFLLRCRNDDGSFGSYEARRAPRWLDALNPSEMFRECMVEGSYVECTGSAIAALVAFEERHPDEAAALDVARRIDEARRFLLGAQRADGSWDGAWGVQRLYGTMFGVRGLRAAGHAPHHAAIARAVAFLRRVQHSDGSFGELPTDGGETPYADLGRGHAVQTAWAAIALAESGRDDAFAPLERAARYLERTQDPEGGWPRDRMVGAFFRTALVDYDLYRYTFPLTALAMRAQVRARKAS